MKKKKKKKKKKLITSTLFSPLVTCVQCKSVVHRNGKEDLNELRCSDRMVADQVAGQAEEQEQGQGQEENQEDTSAETVIYKKTNTHIHHIIMSLLTIIICI